MAARVTRRGWTVLALVVLVPVVVVSQGGPEPAGSSADGAAAAEATGPLPYDDDADCRQVDCVALTFDDGPTPHTSELLDVLAANGVRATFFVVGARIEERPEVVRREAAEGHEIGNHTWSHAFLTRLSEGEARAELTRTADLVEAWTGTRPTLVRPPYGDHNATVDALLGGPGVLWDVDPSDYRSDDPAAIAATVVEQAAPGSIILLHDTNAATPAAVSALVPRLRERGLRFVTVSHLLAEESVRRGVAYGLPEA